MQYKYHQELNTVQTPFPVLSPGDLVFRVRPLHSAVHSRRCDCPLCGGQQHHPAHEADAEAGRRSVLLLLPRQQACQPLYLCHIPPEHPVLPHLVPRSELRLTGTQWILSHHHNGDEHHDPDLLLSFTPCRLLPSKYRQTLRGTERGAQQQF